MHRLKSLIASITLSPDSNVQIITKYIPEKLIQAAIFYASLKNQWSNLIHLELDQKFHNLNFQLSNANASMP